MLKQKIILNFFPRIGVRILQIAAGIIVARLAGPEVLGTVAFGTAYVLSFSFISDLGLGGAHVKLLSEGRDEGDCISTFTRLKFISTGLFFFSVIGFFLAQKYLLHIHFESNIHQIVIFIMLFAGTIQSLLQIPEGTFGGKIEIAKLTLPFIIRNVIYHLLRIIVVILGFKALAIALGNLISYIIIVPLILYLFRGYPQGTYNRQLSKDYLKIAFPLVISVFSVSLFNSLDKVLLQFFSLSKEVGYYAAGSVIGKILLIIQGSVEIFFPLFSKAIAEEKTNYITDKINKWERTIYIFLMPLTISLTIYADSFILFILGTEYTPAIKVMMIVNIAMFLRLLLIPYGNVLTGKGLFKLTAKIEIINLVVFLASLILFLHPAIFNLRAAGAALSLLVSNIFRGILFVLLAKKKLLELKQVNNWKYLIFGILNMVIFYQIYHSDFFHDEPLLRHAFPFLHLATTFASLFFLKWINRSDVTILKSFLDFSKMKSYIKGEISEK